MTANELYDWIIQNWGGKLAKLTGTKEEMEALAPSVDTLFAVKDGDTHIWSTADSTPKWRIFKDGKDGKSPTPRGVFTHTNHVPNPQYLDIASVDGTAYINKSQTVTPTWEVLAAKGKDGRHGLNGLNGSNGSNGTSLTVSDQEVLVGNPPTDTQYVGTIYLDPVMGAAVTPVMSGGHKVWQLVSKRGHTGKRGPKGEGASENTLHAWFNTALGAASLLKAVVASPSGGKGGKGDTGGKGDKGDDGFSPTVKFTGLNNETLTITKKVGAPESRKIIPTVTTQQYATRTGIRFDYGEGERSPEITVTYPYHEHHEGDEVTEGAVKYFPSAGETRWYHDGGWRTLLKRNWHFRGRLDQAPIAPDEGDYYYDTESHELLTYTNNGTWEPFMNSSKFLGNFSSDDTVAIPHLELRARHNDTYYNIRERCLKFWTGSMWHAVTAPPTIHAGMHEGPPNPVANDNQAQHRTGDMYFNSVRNEFMTFSAPHNEWRAVTPRGTRHFGVINHEPSTDETQPHFVGAVREGDMYVLRTTNVLYIYQGNVWKPFEIQAAAMPTITAHAVHPVDDGIVSGIIYVNTCTKSMYRSTVDGANVTWDSILPGDLGVFNHGDAPVEPPDIQNLPYPTGTTYQDIGNGKSFIRARKPGALDDEWLEISNGGNEGDFENINDLIDQADVREIGDTFYNKKNKTMYQKVKPVDQDVVDRRGALRPFYTPLDLFIGDFDRHPWVGAGNDNLDPPPETDIDEIDRLIQAGTVLYTGDRGDVTDHDNIRTKGRNYYNNKLEQYLVWDGEGWKRTGSCTIRHRGTLDVAPLDEHSRTGDYYTERKSNRLFFYRGGGNWVADESKQHPTYLGQFAQHPWDGEQVQGSAQDLVDDPLNPGIDIDRDAHDYRKYTLGNFYHNTENKNLYFWNGTHWKLLYLAEDAKWFERFKGELRTHPLQPVNGDTYYNTLDGVVRKYMDGAWRSIGNRAGQYMGAFADKGAIENTYVRNTDNHTLALNSENSTMYLQANTCDAGNDRAPLNSTAIPVYTPQQLILRTGTHHPFNGIGNDDLHMNGLGALTHEDVPDLALDGAMYYNTVMQGFYMWSTDTHTWVPHTDRHVQFYGLLGQAPDLDHDPAEGSYFFEVGLNENVYFINDSWNVVINGRLGEYLGAFGELPVYSDLFQDQGYIYVRGDNHTGKVYRVEDGAFNEIRGDELPHQFMPDCAHHPWTGADINDTLQPVEPVAPHLHMEMAKYYNTTTHLIYRWDAVNWLPITHEDVNPFLGEHDVHPVDYPIGTIRAGSYYYNTVRKTTYYRSAVREIEDEEHPGNMTRVASWREANVHGKFKTKYDTLAELTNGEADADYHTMSYNKANRTVYIKVPHANLGSEFIPMYTPTWNDYGALDAPPDAGTTGDTFRANGTGHVFMHNGVNWIDMGNPTITNTHHGELADAPAEARIGDYYYDTVDKVTKVHLTDAWHALSNKKHSVKHHGSLNEAPANPSEGDLYYNQIDNTTLMYTDTGWKTIAEKSHRIKHLGNLAVDPALDAPNANVGDVYYNTSTSLTKIHTSDGWKAFNTQTAGVFKNTYQNLEALKAGAEGDAYNTLNLNKENNTVYIKVVNKEQDAVVLWDHIPMYTPPAPVEVHEHYLGKQAVDPDECQAGDYYYNTTDNHVYLYDGATWSSLTGGAQPGADADNPPDNPQRGDYYYNSKEDAVMYYNADTQTWHASNRKGGRYHGEHENTAAFVDAVMLRDGDYYYDQTEQELKYYINKQWTRGQHRSVARFLGEFEAEPANIVITEGDYYYNSKDDATYFRSGDVWRNYTDGGALKPFISKVSPVNKIKRVEVTRQAGVGITKVNTNDTYVNVYVTFDATQGIPVVDGGVYEALSIVDNRRTRAKYRVTVADTALFVASVGGAHTQCELNYVAVASKNIIKSVTEYVFPGAQARPCFTDGDNIILEIHSTESLDTIKGGGGFETPRFACITPDMYIRYENGVYKYRVALPWNCDNDDGALHNIAWSIMVTSVADRDNFAIHNATSKGFSGTFDPVVPVIEYSAGLTRLGLRSQATLVYALPEWVRGTNNVAGLIDIEYQTDGAINIENPYTFTSTKKVTTARTNSNNINNLNDNCNIMIRWRATNTVTNVPFRVFHDTTNIRVTSYNTTVQRGAPPQAVSFAFTKAVRIEEVTALNPTDLCNADGTYPLVLPREFIFEFSRVHVRVPVNSDRPAEPLDIEVSAVDEANNRFIFRTTYTVAGQVDTEIRFTHPTLTAIIPWKVSDRNNVYTNGSYKLVGAQLSHAPVAATRLQNMAELNTSLNHTAYVVRFDLLSGKHSIQLNPDILDSKLHGQYIAGMTYVVNVHERLDGKFYGGLHSSNDMIGYDVIDIDNQQ